MIKHELFSTEHVLWAVPPAVSRLSQAWHSLLLARCFPSPRLPFGWITLTRRQVRIKGDTPWPENASKLIWSSEKQKHLPLHQHDRSSRIKKKKSITINMTVFHVAVWPTGSEKWSSHLEVIWFLIHLKWEIIRLNCVKWFT